MRIVIPIQAFGKSGGFRVLSNFANYWINNSNTVTFLSFYQSEVPYYPTNAEIIWINEKGEVTERKEGEVEKKLLFKRLKGIKKYLKKHTNDYDVVIANSSLTAWPVTFSSIRIKVHYIQAYEPEFYSAKGLTGKIRRMMVYLVYYLPLIRIVNADIYLKYKNLHSKYVVPPGLDLDLYYTKSADKYWDGKRPLVIGHIGRTEEWKGSKDVAAAVKLLQEEGANIVYKVAFNPPENGSCKFELVKPDGDNNLAEYYRSVDVLVAPGHIQLGAIHYPVIEAMACGTPVITTGYYPANNDNAYIVGIKSPNEIANAIKSIMSDYSLAMSKVEKASQEIEAFSWENVSKKMLSIIEENTN